MKKEQKLAIFVAIYTALGLVTIFSASEWMMASFVLATAVLWWVVKR